ncbi:DUF4190 domain-containing protein [Streptomyces sp. SID8379]|uniref:DUF4190 domain-containing protein n=1 Tax=unclassified Streptomyces TaxID=2593676 RepID=UPI0003806A23|nr:MULTISPECIES: DUF4190 domain-containing protein [unclassified Streptomyces]MYW65375.1 DUF4190 domain-containing protein [Streptomyces sp. SID8379]
MTEYDPYGGRGRWGAPAAHTHDSYGYANPYAPPGEPVPPPPVGPEGPGVFPYPAYAWAAGYGKSGPRNGFGVASLILGIVTAVGFLLWPFAIVTGVLAVVFGVLGRRRANRSAATNGGQALAGFICGLGGLILAVLLAVVFLVGRVGDDDGPSDPEPGSDEPGYSIVLR